MITATGVVVEDAGEAVVGAAEAAAAVDPAGNHVIMKMVSVLVPLSLGLWT